MVLKPLRAVREFFAGRDNWLEEGQGITRDDFKKAYTELIRSASSTLQIVTDDSHLVSYDTDCYLLDALSTFLKSPTTHLDMVLHLLINQNEISDPVPILEAYPRFIKVLRSSPDSFYLYTAKSFPRIHYTIADGKNVFFEEPEHPLDGPRYVCARLDDATLGRTWQKLFKDYLEREATRVNI